MCNVGCRESWQSFALERASSLTIKDWGALNDNQVKRQLELRRQPLQPQKGSQCWSDLMFIHWQVDPDKIQETLPAGLTVDTFDGDAYLGIVPFMMSRVKVGWLPVVPWICAFPETNLRTYVIDEAGDPGVWFYSLEAARVVPVMAARMFWHLNYRWAKMSINKTNNKIEYRGDRMAKPHASYHVDAEIFSNEPAKPAEPGSLTFFLVERYVMFTQSGSSPLYSGRVWHSPYQLLESQVNQCEQTITDAAGFEVDRTPDHVIYSPGVETKLYPLQALVQ